MSVAELQEPGVLAGFLVKRQLAEWIPADIQKQLPAGHRHTWVLPQVVHSRLSNTTSSKWRGICRECLCQLSVVVETEGTNSQNACIDESGHHFHSKLSTTAETSNDQENGSEAMCHGRVRCCKCGLAARIWQKPPVIEPDMAAALAKARMDAQSHHPTQGVRDLMSTVTTLFKLVKNACSGNSRPIKVDSEAPRRLLKFDPPCNHILEILGFELVKELEFYPPGIVYIAGKALDSEDADKEASMTQVKTSLIFRRLEHVREELSIWAGQIQRHLPRDERQATYVPKHVSEALGDALGAHNYKRRSESSSLLMGTGTLHNGKRTTVEDAFHALGVPEDAADSLVGWAYMRLMEEDQSGDPLFGPQARRRFDSLVTISAARSSKELGVLVENERERGMVASGAVQAACTALFGGPQSDIETVDGDTIREVFLARLGEASTSKAKMELSEHLAVLADAKQDQSLKSYASNVLSDLEASAEIQLGSPGVSGWKGKVNIWEQLPVGLKNIGNTCYLNSILQCLFSILPIRQAVMCFGDGLTWNEKLVVGRQDSGRLLTEDELAVALRFVALLKKLFESLISQRVEGWASSRVRKSAGGHPLATSINSAPLAVTPDQELADMLLLRVGSSSATNTSGENNSISESSTQPGRQQQQQQQQQQDVDECMAQCIGLLVHALPPSDKAIELSEPDQTWIYKLLTGHLELATEKLGANGAGEVEKPLVDAFINLNLNIPTESADINDCIDAFFAPSAISEGSDAMDTSTDTDTPKQELVRRSRIRDAPPVLCMQVQRVQFDMATMQPFKINSHLRLRKQISLTPFKHFDGAAAAHAQRYELQQRMAAITKKLTALHVPIQTPANDSVGGTPVSVVSAIERVQAFMSGVSRWADLDDAKSLLDDLPGQSASSIADCAGDISKQLSQVSSTLKDARLQWEQELKETRTQLENIYNDVPIDDMAYTLHAVFIHSGATPEFGHYWVYVRDFDKEKNLTRWLKFNDSHVSVVDPTDIFRDAPRPGEELANPYYLVYVRTSEMDAMVDLGV
ncbi:cysteine proteinase [Coemansia reversa NRRL 1564]|uniref:ubiquitinyl hydrolase 1 n=1 Tax=Coemansia reversa (strain ATCC 12441 / NRRL 1564) TaxID=763665 RepID=A0A2G5BG23_COERN|nr:cysteine proteinase [Coemansia reversa NRRL 1564]|eukprot:PIA17951.1 cysteine proteinase [Coemansia reversa NRRL 1564]